MRVERTKEARRCSVYWRDVSGDGKLDIVVESISRKFPTHIFINKGGETYSAKGNQTKYRLVKSENVKDLKLVSINHNNPSYNIWCAGNGKRVFSEFENKTEDDRFWEMIGF